MFYKGIRLVLVFVCSLLSISEFLSANDADLDRHLKKIYDGGNPSFSEGDLLSISSLPYTIRFRTDRFCYSITNPTDCPKDWKYNPRDGTYTYVGPQCFLVKWRWKDGKVNVKKDFSYFPDLFLDPYPLPDAW